MVDDDSQGGEMEDAPEEAPKRPERRAPAKPSDLLGQRRAMASRTFRDTPKATSERLRAHAEKYGVDQVAETGAEAGMDEEQLTNLIASLDRINATFRRDPRRKHLFQNPVKTTPGYRARLLLGIEEPEPLTKSSRSDARRGTKVRRTEKGGSRGKKSSSEGDSASEGRRAQGVRRSGGGDRRRGRPAERPGRSRGRRVP